MKQYQVIALHPTLPRFVEYVTVRETQYPSGKILYYATNLSLGCGKDYNTEFQAICGLLKDHAYYKISAVVHSDYLD